jgi:hypothetical protein
MPKDLIREIEGYRTATLLSVGRNAKLHLQYQDGTPPSKNDAGFYWFYTDYTDEELRNAEIGNKRGAVNPPVLAHAHIGLAHVCNIEHDGFRLVYNGSAGDDYLRSRIIQHFTGGDGTGSLHILGSTLNDLARWKVSYVTSTQLAAHRQPNEHYYLGLHAKHFERLWRPQYGWPRFCTY